MTRRELLCISSHKDDISKTYSFVLWIATRCRLTSTWRWFFLLSCSGSQFKSFNNFCISRRMCNAVCPGFIIHSNSIASPSILSNSLRESFQFDSPFIVWLRERTDFPKTQNRVWEYVNFCLREIDYLFVVHQGQPFPWRSRRTYFWHSWDFQSLFLNQSLCHIDNFFTVGFSSVFLMTCRFCGVIFSKKDGCAHWRSHEYSHVRECVSMSSMLSPDGRFNIIRNLLFTLSTSMTHTRLRVKFPFVNRSASWWIWRIWFGSWGPR